MKKFLLIAILAMATMVCNAQVFVGGTFGVSTDKAGDAARVTTFTIAPTVGYNFNDNLSAGVELGYSYLEHGSSVNYFNFGPYVRYNFFNNDTFAIFGEAAINYLNQKPEGFDSLSGLGVFVRPGISYMLNDNWQILAKTNLFSFKHYNHDGGNATGFAIDLTNIQLGIVYNF